MGMGKSRKITTAVSTWCNRVGAHQVGAISSWCNRVGAISSWCKGTYFLHEFGNFFRKCFSFFTKILSDKCNRVGATLIIKVIHRLWDNSSHSRRL